MSGRAANYSTLDGQGAATVVYELGMRGIFEEQTGRVVVRCPAKLNLYLAVTGRREDGYHDVVSLVVTLDYGDTLTVIRAEDGAGFAMKSDDATLPVDGTNLVLRAAAAFAGATGWRGGASFALEKRVPAGAGLGGGSSDAAGALWALNTMAGRPLAGAALREVAATVGSDCPLFLGETPAVMRGRGERLDVVAGALRRRLAGQRVLVFKPSFGVNTAWAYRALAARAPGSYVTAEEAEAGIARWGEVARRPWGELLFNSFEAVVADKYPAIPVVFEQLQARHGLAPRMSGSGSACFAMLPVEVEASEIRQTIAAAWGEAAWGVETVIEG